MINKIKEIIMVVLRALFKISNMIVFFTMMAAAMILYWVNEKVLSAIVIAVLMVYMIMNKLDNHELRLRELEK